MPRKKSVPPTPTWVDPNDKTVRGLAALAHQAAALADLPLERPSELLTKRRPPSDDNNPNIGG